MSTVVRKSSYMYYSLEPYWCCYWHNYWSMGKSVKNQTVLFVNKIKKKTLLKVLQKTDLYHAIFSTINFGYDADVAIVCLICRHTWIFTFSLGTPSGFPVEQVILVFFLFQNDHVKVEPSWTLHFSAGRNKTFDTDLNCSLLFSSF